MIPTAVRSVGKFQYRKALEFLTSSDLLTCPVTPDTNGFCLGIKIKLLTGTSNGGSIVSWETAHDNAGFAITMDTSARTFGAKVMNGASIVSNRNGGAWVYGTWNTLVVTFVPNNHNLYINGVGVGADTSCTMTAPATTMTIMRNSFDTGRNVKGRVAEFVFHNTASPWTQKQISDWHNLSIVPPGATCVYNMRGDVLDSSGNANNGTLTNGQFISDTSPTATPRD